MYYLHQVLDSLQGNKVGAISLDATTIWEKDCMYTGAYQTVAFVFPENVQRLWLLEKNSFHLFRILKIGFRKGEYR
jgi:hypothetical protein